MTTNDPRGLRPQLVEIGKEAHRLLHKACTDKGMALTKHDHEDGRVIVSTLASFIWAASSSLGGDPIDERDVAIARKYLLSTGNVHVLGEVGSTRKFRIWVREQWSDTSIPPSTNGNGAANGRAQAEAQDALADQRSVGESSDRLTRKSRDGKERNAKQTGGDELAGAESASHGSSVACPVSMSTTIGRVPERSSITMLRPSGAQTEP